MAEAQVTVAINAVNNTQRAFNRASGGFDRLKSKIANSQAAFQKMAIGGAAAFAGISAGIGKAVQEAGQAQDIENLFSLAFDNTEDRLHEFTNTFANEFGRSQTRIRDMAQRLGFSLQMGTDMGEEGIAKMVEQLTPAAEGLALVDSNVQSGSAAMQAMVDAFNGSTDQLRRWIPTVREGIIEQTALEEGIISQGEELNRTQRAMALFKVINEGTAKAQEALNNQTDSYRNLITQFRDQTKEAGIALGNTFLPAITDALKVIVPIVKNISEWVEKNPEFTKAIVIATGVFAGLVAVAGTLGLIIGGLILGFGSLAAPIFLVIAVVSSLIFLWLALRDRFGSVMEFLKSAWEEFKILFVEGVTKIGKFLKKWLIDKPLDLVKTTWGNIKDIFSNVWDSIKKTFETGVKAALGSLKPLLDAVNTIQSFSVGLGKQFARGVSRIGSSIGIDDAIITPQGQVIKTHPDDYIMATKSPGSMGGGGGITVINNGNMVGANPEELTEMLGDDALMSELKLDQRI